MAIGDVKISLLNEEQFLKIAGDDWVPLDGRDVEGSGYHSQTGQKNIPNMSNGEFIRNVGGKATAMGMPQDQGTNKSAISNVFSAGSATTADAAHSHKLFVHKQTDYKNTHTGTPSTSNKSTLNSNINYVYASPANSPTCPAKTSTANLGTLKIDSAQWNDNQNWTTDDETRPVNFAFYHYIQIN